jgi:hypothetical protein
MVATVDLHNGAMTEPIVAEVRGAEADPKELQFYAASVAAWYATKLELDRTSVTLSAAATGLLVGLATSDVLSADRLGACVVRDSPHQLRGSADVPTRRLQMERDSLGGALR